jgi:hypothetical protein
MLDRETPGYVRSKLVFRGHLSAEGDDLIDPRSLARTGLRTVSATGFGETCLDFDPIMGCHGSSVDEGIDNESDQVS